MKKNIPQKNQPARKKTVQTKKNMLKPPSSAKANRYFILAFFIWAFILYGNTVLNKYAVDDEFVTNNEVVKKGLKAVPEIFSTHYAVQKGNVSTQVSDYRPIVKLTFLIEHQLWGERPGVSHGINVLFYFWLSTVLFFVLRRLLQNYNILFPFLITVLFMAHPVHTEVVASLKNRDEMIAFLCAMLTMHYFLKYADTRKYLYIGTGIVIFMVGYLAKSSILPFLALYPLVFWFFTDLKPKNYLLVFLLVFAAVLVAHFLPRAFLPDVQRVNSYIENPLYFEKSFWLRIGTGLVSLLFYLRILIYPHPLIYYYGYDMIPVVNPLNIWAILSLIIVAGLFLYALYKFREKHILSFSILWFLVAISMYSNIVMPVVGIVGERFVFIASLGFCIALVYLIFRVFKTDPKSLTIEFDSRAKIIVVMALLLIPSTALTITRNREWRNPYDLYRKDIKYQAKSAKANTQYAGHLMNMALKDPNFLQSGEVNQFLEQTIISFYRRALDIYPASYQTVNDLGSVYLFFAKNPDSAIYFLNKALEMRPELIPARVNLGMAYREKGDYPKAIENYESILKINPGEVRAIFALANVYFDMGDVAKAVKMNEDVMATNPQLDMPYINLGNYAIQKGDTARAVGYYEQALQRRPTYEGFMQLSYLYKIHGDMERAVFYQQQAQQLTNASPQKRPLLK